MVAAIFVLIGSLVKMSQEIGSKKGLTIKCFCNEDDSSFYFGKSAVVWFLTALPVSTVSINAN